MSWTDDRIQMLRNLWADGLSCSQIANELGNGISRNAVIGKVHRIGLTGRAKKPTKPRKITNGSTPHVNFRADRLVRHRLSDGSLPPGSIESDLPPPPKPINMPESTAHAVVLLERSHCRFPVGDPQQPGFFFCSAMTQDDIPYCDFHRAACWDGAPRRPNPVNTYRPEQANRARFA